MTAKSFSRAREAARSGGLFFIIAIGFLLRLSKLSSGCRKLPPKEKEHERYNQDHHTDYENHHVASKNWRAETVGEFLQLNPPKKRAAVEAASKFLFSTSPDDSRRSGDDGSRNSDDGSNRDDGSSDDGSRTKLRLGPCCWQRLRQ